MFVCVAGKNDISVEILEYLVERQEDRYEIGVVCNKNETGKDSWQKSLRYHAKKMGIREYALQEIYNMQQVLFLSLEFDQIIRPQKFADARLYNIHFSLLPHYRGMYTAVLPILYGETRSGVTLHRIDRLDRNTTGVLLLTNDGDLASKLTHPKFLKKKVYHVHLDKNLTAHDMDQIREGITLEDGEIKADAVEYADDRDKAQVGIEIHSGKNRIVRRIFESLGYRVTKLDRVQFAGLTKKNLRRGDWRFLTEKEVDMLRMGAFE